MKKILFPVLYILLFANFIEAIDGDIKLSERKFFIQKSEICKLNQKLWRTIEAEIVYELKKIKYFKVFHYKANPLVADLPEIIKLKFKIEKCKTDVNFVITAEIKFQKIILKKIFAINSEIDIKEFPVKFTEYLKNKFPLIGVILDIEKDSIKVNIGTKYDIKIGDILLIINEKEKVIGSGIVVDTDINYSEIKITKNIAKIKKSYKVIPYNFSDVNKLNSYKFQFIKKNPNFPYKVEGLKSDKFKIFLSSTANYCIIADSEKSVLLNLNNLYVEKIEPLNCNSLVSAKFSYRNNYAGYIYGTQSYGMRIFNLNDLKKFDILKDPLEERYLLKIHKSSELAAVKITAFDFSKSENLFFFDEEKNAIIKLNIKNKEFSRLNLENPIKNVTKILITPNDKKIIIEYRENNSKNILIKDLEELTEDIVQDIKWWLSDRIGTKLIFYSSTDGINIYNLYTKRYDNLPINIKNIDIPIISFSEQFLAFLRKDLGYNYLDIYDFCNNAYIKDIFKSGELKYIKRIEWIPGYNHLLIFGRLTDTDKNKKIDYRDADELVMFDPITRKSYRLLTKIDDFYGITPDGNYIFYRIGQELYIQQILYEKIFTK